VKIGIGPSRSGDSKQEAAIIADYRTLSATTPCGDLPKTRQGEEGRINLLPFSPCVAIATLFSPWLDTPTLARHRLV